MMTLTQAVADLDAGRTTARALVEGCLERIGDPGGEGARAFVAVSAGPARAMADAMDALRRVNRAPPFAGIPISLKDLFDVRGEPTRAGAAVLDGAEPARAHAPAVARLLRAGFVPVGRTNMTEFAFSGIGINPHHGTPASPWRRPRDGGAGHVPGGSSSGAAVSVADGMALMGLGTDTGGSTRIPAAFCGVVGYKPTARRVPIAGVLPLSVSLDSVGPIAASVHDCALTDAVLADGAPPLPAASLAGLRLAVPTNIVLEGMDPAVSTAWERAVAALSAAGARIEHVRFAALDGVAATGARGTITAAEAYAWHWELLAAQGNGYDPRVRVRIERAAGMSAADLVWLLAERGRLCAQMDAEAAGYDALMMPTAVIAPPPIAELADDDAFTPTNALVLRNTSFFNFLDRCAISLPCHRMGEAPVGLMLAGPTMGDARLFAMAEGVEAALARVRDA